MDLPKLKNVLEAALLVAGRPLSLNDLARLVAESPREYSRDIIREALDLLEADCAVRGIELRRVAGGYQLQVRRELAPFVLRLREEKPPRYSRALFETLALIAYRQPITRAEIEAIRGVSVNTGIINALQERAWIKVVGRRETPGRPAVYGTTHQFLDYFNLKALDELPPLAELIGPEQAQPQLDLDGLDERRRANDGVGLSRDGQHHGSVIEGQSID
jgi:segregation and condensation protein B